MLKIEIFEFSFIKLLNLLKEQGLINQSDVKILKQIRVVKRNYREDVFDELPSSGFIKNLIPIVKKIGFLDSVNIVDSLVFQKNVDKSIITENFSPYQRLRLVEGYYCSQELNIPNLKKIISNPQFYASKMKDDNFTRNLILEIKKKLQNNVYKK